MPFYLTLYSFILLWYVLKYSVLIFIKILVLMGKLLAMIFMLPGTRYSGDWEDKYHYQYYKEHGHDYYDEETREYREEFYNFSEDEKVEDCYAILGVSSEDDLSTIKQVYRSLSKAYHPDINKSKLAEEKIKKINEAWEQVQKLKS